MILEALADQGLLMKSDLVRRFIKPHGLLWEILPTLVQFSDFTHLNLKDKRKTFQLILNKFEDAGALIRRGMDRRYKMPRGLSWELVEQRLGYAGEILVSVEGIAADDGLKEVALYQFGEDVDISSTRFFSQYEDFAGSIRQKDQILIVETPVHGGQ
jgi:hypothetical protein